MGGGIGLGGAELALILTELEYERVAIPTTTRIRVNAAIDWLLSEDSRDNAGTLTLATR